MQKELIAAAIISLWLLSVGCTTTPTPAPTSVPPEPIIEPPPIELPSVQPGHLDDLSQDWLDTERPTLAAWLLAEAASRGLKLGIEAQEITDDVAAALNIRLHDFKTAPEEPTITAAASLTFRLDYKTTEESLKATFAGKLPAYVQAHSDLGNFQVQLLYKHADLCSAGTFAGVKEISCLRGGEVTTQVIDPPDDRLPSENPSPTPQEVLVSGKTVKTVDLHVASVTAECPGLAPMNLLIVNGECFYGHIQGFDWEPGFKYRLRVRMTEVPPEELQTDTSPYKWELLRILEKTRGDGRPVD